MLLLPFALELFQILFARHLFIFHAFSFNISKVPWQLYCVFAVCSCAPRLSPRPNYFITPFCSLHVVVCNWLKIIWYVKYEWQGSSIQHFVILTFFKTEFNKYKYLKSQAVLLVKLLKPLSLTSFSILTEANKDNVLKATLNTNTFTQINNNHHIIIYTAGSEHHHKQQEPDFF